MKLMNLRWVAASSAALIAITALPLHAADSKRDSSRDRERSKQRQSDSKRSSSGDFERLDRLIGSDIRTSDRQKLGTLDNLVLDLESGRVLFAVVDTSEGNRRVAVPPSMLGDVRGDTVYFRGNKDKLANAPRLEGSLDRQKIAQASFVNEVYEHFNQPAWWKGANSANEGSFNNVHDGENLIGMKVVNVQETPVGKVNNVVIDPRAGRIAYVVVDPASEMKAGDKLFAFPPSALTMHKSGKQLTTDTDREKLLAGPSFEKNQWPSLNNHSFASKVYKHYGKQAYFSSDSSTGLTPTGRDSERTYDSSDPDKRDKNWESEHERYHDQNRDEHREFHRESDPNYNRD